MFVKNVGPDITPIQYAILRMVHEKPGVDQVSLARLIGIDTSTTALTAARLENKQLLTRMPVQTNKRQLSLALTKDGESLIESLVANVHRMREELLGSLDEREQAQLMALLRKFVLLNNEQSRAPLKHAHTPDDPPTANSGRAGRR